MGNENAKGIEQPFSSQGEARGGVHSAELPHRQPLLSWSPEEEPSRTLQGL